MRCLNHLETIDRGSIQIEGEVLVQNDASGKAQYVPEAQIRQIGRKMGMVFQSFNLFPHLTVLENLIEAPMLVKKMKREEIVPKAESLLAQGGPVGQARCLPQSPLGRPEAACGDCARAVHGPGHHAV